MLRMLKIVEVVWAAMAVVCLIEFIRLFNSEGDTKWIFGGFMLVSIFMFFFRRRTRHRYEQLKKERESQS